MPVAEVNHQRIFFEDIGSGTPIILGHSFLCSGQMWREQIPTLKDGYRIVNPDLRGHGQSGPARSPFSLYDAVTDAVGVLDLLGIERAIWCGLSIGGMVALRAALVIPERVSALILLDSDAGAESVLRSLRYRSMGLGVKTIGIRPLLPAIIRLMFGATTRRRNPGLIDEWRRRFADVDVQSVLHCLYGLVSRDSVLSCLSEFSVPSLVMVGDEDRSLPASRSQRIHNCLPDSEYQVIRGAGHLSALEQPSQVNGVLTEFLRRVTKSAVAT